MAPDSIVIVDDVVMPKVGASWKQTSMDIAMLTMLAAVERTADHFGLMFKEVGLKIRDIWTYDEDYGDSFIVAVPDNATNGYAQVDAPNGHVGANSYTDPDSDLPNDRADAPNVQADAPKRELDATSSVTDIINGHLAFLRWPLK